MLKTLVIRNGLLVAATRNIGEPRICPAKRSQTLPSFTSNQKLQACSHQCCCLENPGKLSCSIQELLVKLDSDCYQHRRLTSAWYQYLCTLTLNKANQMLPGGEENRTLHV